MRILSLLFVSVILSACGAPKFSGGPMSATNQPIALMKNDQTRQGFFETMKTWLSKNGHSYSVVADGSKHDPSKLTLEYEGQWGWDLALYLKRANIKAFNGGQKVGEVGYRVPYTANPSKFSVASERISYMMDILFGKLGAKEANEIIVRTPEE